MILSSYAKINLSLKINSKRKDGLHEIQSFFCLLNLADKIKLNKIKEKKDKIIFKGPFGKLVNKKKNSIINLLKLLRKLNLISDNYAITINKNIPVFGGLGGGTANAACILKFLSRGKINNSLLNKVEGIIGTDLRLFFYKQGFLKNLTSIIQIKKKKTIFHPYSAKHTMLYKRNLCQGTKVFKKENITSK